MLKGVMLLFGKGSAWFCKCSQIDFINIHNLFYQTNYSFDYFNINKYKSNYLAKQNRNLSSSIKLTKFHKF